MHSQTLILLISLIAYGLHAQDFEVEGKAKVTVMDTVTDISANVVRQSDGTLALRQYQIGDLAQGGIIFYIDESGEHGLVADTIDVSSGIRWYAGTFDSTYAYGDGLFAGEMNTAIIIPAQLAVGDDGNPYAARLCLQHQSGGYGDWYLPSLGELILMYNNLQLQNLGNFEENTYWSSTEINNNSAHSIDFKTGNRFSSAKSNIVRVRAIRAF